MTDVAEHVIISGGIAGCSWLFLAKVKILFSLKRTICKQRAGIAGGIKQQHAMSSVTSKKIGIIFGKIEELNLISLPFIQSGYISCPHGKHTERL
jgi:hypothetical protein